MAQAQTRIHRYSNPCPLHHSVQIHHLKLTKYLSQPEIQTVFTAKYQLHFQKN